MVDNAQQHFEDEEMTLKKQWFITQKVDAKIGDFYDLQTKKVIGQGQFGTAYLMNLKNSQEQRAVKVIPKERIENQSDLIHEITIMKKLDHPNVIKLYEVFEDTRNIYLCMELCTGGELFDRISNSGKISESYTRHLFLSIAKAICYCHSHKICHRDLKPENFILLDNAEESPIKIIDFGLSCNLKGQKLKLKAGSAYYMSPEVLEGKYSELCDVWSLGVILYIMLSGIPPFYGNNDQAIFDQIIKGQYNLEVKQLQNVSESAKDLIKKCLVLEDDRLTASQLCEHPWMKQDIEEVNCAISLENLRNFAHGQKLKKLALTYIASQMAEKDIQQLGMLFKKIDINNDGSLTFQEFKSSLDAALNESEKAKLTELFKLMDSDHSGKIDYTEFIAATMGRSHYMKDSKLRSVFHMLDTDGSGKIDKNELKNILAIHKAQQGHDDQYWEQMIKDCDTNGDGEIDYEEFVAMMNKQN